MRRILNLKMRGGILERLVEVKRGTNGLWSVSVCKLHSEYVVDKLFTSPFHGQDLFLNNCVPFLSF